MKVNHIYKISQTPCIYLSIGSKHWNELPEHNEKSYLLSHPMWYFSWSSILLYFKQKKSLRKKNISLIILNNSKQEHYFAKIFGFRSFLINQNIQVCENHFKIITEKVKEYDAVYIAAAKPYKRIHLAEKIRSLYIITYFWPDIRDKNGNWDLHAFEPRVKHAAFNKQRLDKDQISDILNRSKCALALSRKEGAMLAIMEYFYSGLPVVSTKSIGGRDFFYNKDYVSVVKASPDIIKKEVERMIVQDINPWDIRINTIKKVKQHRKDFYNVIKGISAESNNKVEDFETFHERIWGGDGIFKHFYYPKTE